MRLPSRPDPDIGTLPLFVNARGRTGHPDVRSFPSAAVAHLSVLRRQFSTPESVVASWTGINVRG